MFTIFINNFIKDALFVKFNGNLVTPLKNFIVAINFIKIALIRGLKKKKYVQSANKKYFQTYD